MDHIVNKFVSGGVLFEPPFGITHKDNKSILYYKKVAYIVLNFNTSKLSIRPSSTPPKALMKVLNKVLNRMGQEVLEAKNGNLYFAYTNNPINPIEWLDIKL